MKTYQYFLIALLIIIIDQVSKLLVHEFMYLHQEITVIGNEQYGFKLYYLLNPGMAFGLKWDNEFGKLALTGFRIIAMFGISYYLVSMAKQNAHKGFLICMALILGGAVGNVIDSTFYGVLLNNAPADSSTPWFHGQVIDMLFFKLFDFTWPEWMPLVGGEYFLFFGPVFNIADSSIFIGVVIILFRQKTFFKEAANDDATAQAEVNQASIISSEDVSPIADSTENANKMHESDSDQVNQPKAD
jgi:signal peptidase II